MGIVAFIGICMKKKILFSNLLLGWKKLTQHYYSQTLQYYFVVEQSHEIVDTRTLLELAHLVEEY